MLEKMCKFCYHLSPSAEKEYGYTKVVLCYTDNAFNGSVAYGYGCKHFKWCEEISENIPVELLQK